MQWVPLSIILEYWLVMGTLSCLHLLLSHSQVSVGIPRSWMITLLNSKLKIVFLCIKFCIL